MNGRTWIKLQTDMFDNRKIKKIRRLPAGNDILLLWIMLLAIAGKRDADGVIGITDTVPYTEEDLACELGFEISTVKLGLKAFCELGMLSVTNNGMMQVLNWNRYQTVDTRNNKILSKSNKYISLQDNKDLFLKDLFLVSNDENVKQGVENVCKNDGNLCENVEKTTANVENVCRNVENVCRNVENFSDNKEKNEKKEQKESKNESEKEKVPQREKEKVRKREKKEKKEKKEISFVRSKIKISEPCVFDDGDEDIIKQCEIAKDKALTWNNGYYCDGVVMISNDQMLDLCERLSIDEMEKYINIVKDCEASGKHYKKKSHYQAILDMVEADRATRKK